jgi:protein-S-isoprenylcysteine O-methyltransferase Ste14
MWALGTGVYSSSATRFESESAEARRTRSRDERLFDGLLAGSVVFWAIAGFVAARVDALFLRVPLLLVHLAVALLLSLRSRPLRRATRGASLACLPALAVAGVAFELRAEEGSWPAPAQFLFLLGSVVTLWAFASLGRSFAILPAVRSVVTEGAYRWVRHPAYAGEILMVFGCALSRPAPMTISLLLVALPLLALRIRIEETLLLSSEAYRAYARRVRYRLAPGVW